MSTIKSDSENLTLNAHGSGNDIKFQSNSSEVGSLTAEGVMTTTLFSGSGASLTALPAAQVSGTHTAFRSTGIDDNADTLAITIDSSEKVGIGTASPSTLVHIKAASAAKLRVEETGGSYGELEAGGSGMHLVAKSGGYITLRPNATEAVRLLSDGKVGIGTTSPN